MKKPPPKPKGPHAHFPTLAPRALFTNPVVEVRKRPTRGAVRKPKIGLNPGKPS